MVSSMGGGRVPAVDLVEIDEVGAQAAQGLVDVHPPPAPRFSNLHLPSCCCTKSCLRSPHAGASPPAQLFMRGRPRRTLPSQKPVYPAIQQKLALPEIYSDLFLPQAAPSA